MSTPRCAVCGADVTDAGALVDFLPREADLAWHATWCDADESTADDSSRGEPPDAAWLCARHLECGLVMARRLDIGRGLALLREADAGVEVRGQLAATLGVDEWERVLRRALPDFAIEIGSDRVEIEEDWQTSYLEDSEIPAGASNGVECTSWSVGGDQSMVGVDRIAVYWRSGAVARTDVHIGSVGPHAPGWSVWVTPDADATRFGSQHVSVHGEPSPLMGDLLRRYGLDATRVRP
ncbi:hypothetical protein [Demequina muriae]|uniref:Uncharacterized protein n=1 Tax=Demequina muriae TaxID=3051664 RepID=A0ABT8GJ75_9MICO|nr:hypothetical protein [Demequina sp. EGI L300058]MDN4481477.1 hypothetical protein [Demequina sp. EGI L300058]